MSAVRVVLSNGEDDELDLGVFNQGVVVQTIDDKTLSLVDVASSETICLWSDQMYLSQRGPGFFRYGKGPYEQMFVQAVEDQHLPALIQDMDMICRRGDS